MPHADCSWGVLIGGDQLWLGGCSTALDQVVDAEQDESSDELFYIGALSYADVLEEFSGYFHDPAVRLLYLIAEHVVLAGPATLVYSGTITLA